MAALEMSALEMSALEVITSSQSFNNIVNSLGKREGSWLARTNWRCQIKSATAEDRQNAAEQLADLLRDLKGLRMPFVMPGCTHSYYMFPMVLDIDLLQVPRSRLIEALTAEGITGLTAGYVNVHLLPIYQQKIAYGSSQNLTRIDLIELDRNYRVQDRHK